MPLDTSINATSPLGPPLDLRTVPRELLSDGRSGVNPSMRNNPYFPEVRYNPRAYDPSEWNRQRQAINAPRVASTSSSSNYNPAAYDPSEFLRQQAGVSVDEWTRRQQPINAGGTIPTSRSVNPGRAVNPRIPRVPRLSPGSVLRGGASLGIEALGEAAIDAAWDKVAPDREERYRERTRDPRPLRPSHSEANAGIGALGAGPIGVTAAAAAAVTRYLLPDDTDIGNPNGVLGRVMGWNDEYPNQTDPDSLNTGPQIEEGQPAQPGEPGGVAGAAYAVVWSVEAYPSYARQAENTYSGLIGPITQSTGTDFGWWGGPFVQWRDFSGANGTSVRVTVTRWFSDGTVQFRNGAGGLVRTDGGTDPPAQPEVPPTYAANPARGRPGTGGAPALLPPAPTPDLPGYQPGGDLPWPETAPQTTPDTTPLAPTPEAPPEFQDSPLTSPNTPTAPGTLTSPPDLEGDPKPEPPNLQDDPHTPEKSPELGSKNEVQNQDGSKTYELPDGTRITDYPDGSRKIDSPVNSPWIDQLHNPTRPPIPPIIPIPLKVGEQQKLDTPSRPDLNNRTTENPNVQRIREPVKQTPPEGPKGTCFYEFQRVADIQRKATDTQQRASNSVSGFPGLYGLQIESRTKLGQTYDNTEEIKKRIRPEDFPIIVPEQIANPTGGTRTIESLAELGVWIVQQLDGVVGKWPMTVPVPGLSEALAVPNMSEAIAEMFGMMISQQVTAAQILNTSSRTLAQAGSATQQAALANMIAKGNAEFLGYQAQPTAVDMPLTYTPGNDPGEGLLEESTAKIQGWKNNDDTDLKRILQDVLHGIQIIKAVYWRKLDPKSDLKAQIDEQIKGKSDFLDDVAQPSGRESDDWEQYLRDTEAGFSRYSSDGTPYGRTPDEGPKIRDITPPEA